jgi:hypothetical protein
VSPVSRRFCAAQSRGAEGDALKNRDDEDEAIVRLLLWQRGQGYVAMTPGRDYTERTKAAWAFFNIRGYLGTVTEGARSSTRDGS